MRLSDYLDRYQIEDLEGCLLAALAGLVTVAAFITVLEIMREASEVCGVIQ